MSDDVKHGDDELELDTTVEDTEADDVSTDDAKSTDDKSDDSSASLDLEEGNGTQADDKKTAAKQVQVKALAAKILTGELTYEKFPAAQKWLLSDVMEMVSSAKGTKAKPADEGEVSKLVQKELEKERFSNRLKEVKAASLSTAENLAITERFKFLRAKGFSQLEALEDSLTFHRIDLAKAKPRQPVMKEGGNGKASNQQRKVEDVDIDEINSMSPRQLAALNGQKAA